MKQETRIPFVIRFGDGSKIIVHAKDPHEAYEKAKVVGEIASVTYLHKKRYV